jgi:transposase
LKTRDETDVLPALTADLRLSRLHSLVRYKWLEAGKFVWPPIRDGAMQMTREEFSLLLAGIDWTRVKQNPVKRPLKVG